jgi:hypothetical protein
LAVRLTIACPRDRSTLPPAAALGVRLVDLKAADTLFEASMVTVQVVAVPLQAPSQPVKAAVRAGVAVSVTSEPSFSFAVQVVPPFPHWIPPPLTEPGPVTVTVRLTVPEVVPPENVAVTLFAAFIVTVQVVEPPLQAPPQLVKLAPLSGVAVSVTVAPVVSFTVHVVCPDPQLIPPPVTVPLPVTETPSGNWDAVPDEPLKEAVTLFAVLIVTEQDRDVPAHAPPQPVKLAPELGWAVRLTVVPADTSALQLDPPAEVQEMLDPATVPFPVTETVSANVVADVVNVAVTSRSALIVTVHVTSPPPQAPPQPENV